MDIDVRLGGDLGSVLGRDADDILDLGDHAVGIGAGQVDLVDDRHNLQSAVNCQISIRQRLRFDSLRSVHHQNRALASGERTRDLIVEVNVSGGIDQIK